jgi:hypothetical protein
VRSSRRRKAISCTRSWRRSGSEEDTIRSGLRSRIRDFREREIHAEAEESPWRQEKRFKKTATGKFMRGKAFKRHILTSKPTRRKRQARGSS